MDLESFVRDHFFHKLIRIQHLRIELYEHLNPYIMENLIVFMSKHGTTRKVALQLQQKLGKEKTHVVDLAKGSVTNLSDYETIIVGGSIHMGQIQKKVKQFCEKHEEELCQKRLGLFICFMAKEEGKKEFDMAYSEQLRAHALAKGLFGGELLIDQMNLIERFMIKKVAKVTENQYELDQEAIDNFVLLMYEKAPKPI